MTYTLTSSTSIIRDADGATIPTDPNNTDYIIYQAWLAAGNTPTPYVAPTPTIQQQIDTLEATMTPRRIREAANGTDNGWMKALDAQIAALRTQLTTT